MRCRKCGDRGCPECLERPVWDVEVEKKPRVLIEMHMGPNDSVFFKQDSDTVFFKVAGLVKGSDDNESAFYLILGRPNQPDSKEWFLIMTLVEGYDVFPNEQDKQTVPEEIVNALMDAAIPRADREWELFEQKVHYWKEWDESH